MHTSATGSNALDICQFAFFCMVWMQEILPDNPGGEFHCDSHFLALSATVPEPVWAGEVESVLSQPPGCLPVCFGAQCW